MTTPIPETTRRLNLLNRMALLDETDLSITRPHDEREPNTAATELLESFR